MKLFKLGVAIMGVPEREARVRRLLERLHVDESVVSWDPNHDGHVANWWRAVALASKEQPTHVLILEDDAEPCRDFLPTVERLVAQYPDRIMSFYYAQPTAAEIVQPGTLKLFLRYRALSDVAVVYPRAWLEALREDFEAKQDELAATHWQVGYGADELRIKLRPLQQVWHTLPSLVQHGCPADSTLGHRIARATAPSFIGAEASALDWAIS